ncbi:MAG: hypothetical protein JWN25_301 [Verrucomicrobiales bacterium]|nr:hypothetical protein [Verrucomicrobiales bacterium]
MKIETLKDLYLEELKDLYSAETQLVKALPQMAKAATSDELRAAFEEHLELTREHVERLDQIFENHDESPKGKKCKAMEGLIEEAKELLEEDIAEDVLDAGLIAAAQRVEHYEIAVYGCVRTYAKLLGLEEEADLLQQTLDEEEETDQTLTDIAESTINIEAVDGDEESSDDSGEEASENSKKGRSSK